DHALERDELLLMYQPKVHARRHDISSVEALVRWQHPERGMVMPSDFIAAAEEVQRIDGLTIWTIRRALRDQMTLRAAGYDL
ncbi:EAL domain-containing protein, partial [Enterococcus sp. HPCN18]